MAEALWIYITPQEAANILDRAVGQYGMPGKRMEVCDPDDGDGCERRCVILTYERRSIGGRAILTVAIDNLEGCGTRIQYVVHGGNSPLPFVRGSRENFSDTVLLALQQYRIQPPEGEPWNR